MAQPISITVAQALGIYSASAISGISFAMSYMAVPPTRQAPAAVALRQWKVIFNLGKGLVPICALINCMCCAYLAYAIDSKPMSRLYVLSGALVFGLIPYTFAAIKPTNAKLDRKLEAVLKLDQGDVYDEASQPEQDRAAAVIEQWRWLNYHRALFPLAGAAVTLYTTFFWPGTVM